MPRRGQTGGGTKDDPLEGRNIVLVGFMGSGKSAVGRLIAERTGRRFVDTDDLVEEVGTPITDIFAAEGEAGFRRREKDAVKRAARCKGAVIATGGGTVLDEKNVRALKSRGVVVYLDVAESELVERLAEDGHRPLLAAPDAMDGPDEKPKAEKKKRIRRMLTRRRPVYEAAADHIVRCTGMDTDRVAEVVLRRVGVGASRGHGPQSVEIAVEHAYRVWVGPGALEQVLDLVPPPEGAQRVCVVSHPRVWRLWGSRLEAALQPSGLEIVVVRFPEGERRKSMDVVERLWRRLAQERFSRRDAVVALGGGVVGDVAGFVASTYARGIACIQVPTTLLAMVDASIGGKTGFNVPEGKNLVGTFAQPAGVVADLDTLTTLPDRELRAGLAEVAKYAFIAEPSLGKLVVERIDEVRSRGEVLEDIVLRSAAIKGRIVAADEREAGVRAHLNYGHTLGHALEAASLAQSGAKPLHHGEAIAIGMVYAAWLAVLTQTADESLVATHERLLGTIGLPTRTGFAWEQVASFLEVDKKRTDELRWVLLTAPGHPVVQGGIPGRVLKAAYERITEA